MIPFVRLFPNGKRSVSGVIRPFEIEAIAARFILAGGRYCCGILTDGEAKLTATIEIFGHTTEVATEHCANGPAILDATDRLIRASAKFSGNA